MRWPVEGFLLFALAAMAIRYPDDADLAQRLKNRDAGAMGELYDRYGRLAYTLILRIVKDRPIAEDLVQESFLRVWTRAQAFDATRGGLGPWILTVARNQALDYIRSVQGRVWSGMSSAADDHPAAFCDWEGDLLAGLQLQQVRTAIQKLSDNQKTAIELAYFEGLSHSEMAERMQQPLGTVKTWVRTALQTLREELSATAPV